MPSLRNASDKKPARLRQKPSKMMAMMGKIALTAVAKMERLKRNSLLLTVNYRIWQNSSFS